MKAKNLLIIPFIMAAPFLKNGKAQNTVSKLSQVAKKEIPAAIKNPLDSASVYRIKPDSINFADTLKLEGIEVTSTKITKPPKVNPKNPPKKKLTFLQQAKRDLKNALNGRPSYDLDDANDGINLQISRRMGNLDYDLRNQKGPSTTSTRLGVGVKKSGDALVFDGTVGAEYVADTLSNKGKAGMFYQAAVRTQNLLEKYSKRLRRDIFGLAIGTKGEGFIAPRRKANVVTNTGVIGIFKPTETTRIESMLGYGTKSGESPGISLDSEIRQGLIVDRKGRSKFDLFARLRHMFGKDATQAEVGLAYKPY